MDNPVSGTSSDSEVAGVKGECTSGRGPGVSGISAAGIGVEGDSTSWFGVVGTSQTGIAVSGKSTEGYGVHGESIKTHGVLGRCRDSGSAGYLESLRMTGTASSAGDEEAWLESATVFKAFLVRARKVWG